MSTCYDIDRELLDEAIMLIEELAVDYAEELEGLRCLKEYGEDCSTEEPCRVCGGWKAVDRAWAAIPGLKYPCDRGSGTPTCIDTEGAAWCQDCIDREALLAKLS